MRLRIINVLLLLFALCGYLHAEQKQCWLLRMPTELAEKLIPRLENESGSELMEKIQDLVKKKQIEQLAHAQVPYLLDDHKLSKEERKKRKIKFKETTGKISFTLRNPSRDQSRAPWHIEEKISMDFNAYKGSQGDIFIASVDVLEAVGPFGNSEHHKEKVPLQLRRLGSFINHPLELDRLVLLTRWVAEKDTILFLGLGESDAEIKNSSRQRGRGLKSVSSIYVINKSDAQKFQNVKPEDRERAYQWLKKRGEEVCAVNTGVNARYEHKLQWIDEIHKEDAPQPNSGALLRVRFSYLDYFDLMDHRVYGWYQDPKQKSTEPEYTWDIAEPLELNSIKFHLATAADHARKDKMAIMVIKNEILPALPLKDAGLVKPHLRKGVWVEDYPIKPWFKRTLSEKRPRTKNELTNLEFPGHNENGDEILARHGVKRAGQKVGGHHFSGQPTGPAGSFRVMGDAQFHKEVRELLERHDLLIKVEE